MTEDWITTHEAAEVSKYHPEHLRELIRQDKIRAIKKGNAWWVSKSSLLVYLKTAERSEDKRRGPKTRQGNIIKL